MRCSVCQLELGVEYQAGEVVLTYSFKDWAERCRHRRNDLLSCAHLKSTILEPLQSNSAIRGKE